MSRGKRRTDYDRFGYEKSVPRSCGRPVLATHTSCDTGNSLRVVRQYDWCVLVAGNLSAHTITLADYGDERCVMVVLEILQGKLVAQGHSRG